MTSYYHYLEVPFSVSDSEKLGYILRIPGKLYEDRIETEQLAILKGEDYIERNYGDLSGENFEEL